MEIHVQIAQVRPGAALSVPITFTANHAECGGSVVFRPIAFRRDLLSGETVTLTAVCRRCGMSLLLRYSLDPALTPKEGMDVSGDTNAEFSSHAHVDPEALAEPAMFPPTAGGLPPAEADTATAVPAAGVDAVVELPVAVGTEYVQPMAQAAGGAGSAIEVSAAEAAPTLAPAEGMPGGQPAGPAPINFEPVSSLADWRSHVAEENAASETESPTDAGGGDYMSRFAERFAQTRETLRQAQEGIPAALSDDNWQVPNFAPTEPLDAQIVPTVDVQVAPPAVDSPPVWPAEPQQPPAEQQQTPVAQDQAPAEAAVWHQTPAVNPSLPLPVADATQQTFQEPVPVAPANLFPVHPDPSPTLAQPEPPQYVPQAIPPQHYAPPAQQIPAPIQQVSQPIHAPLQAPQAYPPMEPTPEMVAQWNAGQSAAAPQFPPPNGAPQVAQPVQNQPATMAPPMPPAMAPPMGGAPIAAPAPTDAQVAPASAPIPQEARGFDWGDDSTAEVKQPANRKFLLIVVAALVVFVGGGYLVGTKLLGGADEPGKTPQLQGGNEQPTETVQFENSGGSNAGGAESESPADVSASNDAGSSSESLNNSSSSADTDSNTAFSPPEQ